MLNVVIDSPLGNLMVQFLSCHPPVPHTNCCPPYEPKLLHLPKSRKRSLTMWSPDAISNLFGTPITQRKKEQQSFDLDQGRVLENDVKGWLLLVLASFRWHFFRVAETSSKLSWINAKIIALCKILLIIFRMCVF